MSMRIEAAPEVLTPLEVSRLLRLGRNKTYDELRAGRIPSRRLGRKVLIFRQELEEWMRSQTTEGRDEARGH